MAVLIQPQLDAAGRWRHVRDRPGHRAMGRLVVEAVSGGPDQLVSGQVTAERLSLDPLGGCSPSTVSGATAAPATGVCWTGASTGRSAGSPRDLEHEYGGPQDVEWAFDARRTSGPPADATGHDPSDPVGPGPGPGPSRGDLPLPTAPVGVRPVAGPDAGGHLARRSPGSASCPGAASAESPVLLAVHGWPAVDLELFGYLDRRPHGWQWIDPRPPARRLAAAWRVGSLRARLTDDVSALLARSDELLASVPATLGDCPRTSCRLCSTHFERCLSTCTRTRSSRRR